LAVYYTWVYNGTGGSLFLVVLLHAAYNTTVTVVLSAWPMFPLTWFIAALWGVALAAFFAERRARRRD
jgi:hypothetical protein